MLEIAVQGPAKQSLLSRRRFVRASLWSCAGLGLPAIQSHEAAGAIQSQRPRDTAVIQIWLGGGPSHIDTYDPKPAAPEQVRGPYRHIATNVPGIQICELLGRQAHMMDRLSIVRSLHHRSNIHVESIHWMQTGNYLPLTDTSNPPHLPHPGIGAVTAWQRGANRPGMVPFVHIAPHPKYRPAYPRVHGAGVLGDEYSPFHIETVRGNDQDDLSAFADAIFRSPRLDLLPDLDVARMHDREATLRRLEDLTRAAERPHAHDVVDNYRRRALELLANSTTRAAFDLSREDPRTRDRYGRTAWGQGALLCRRLVEAGVTFVTLNTDSFSMIWDSHLNLKIAFDQLLPAYDQMLTALIEDLVDRGLFERVILLVWGEFGRTPRMGQVSLNGAGANAAGRDHWGRAAFALLGGGGLRGGVVVGATTRDGGDPRDRPIIPGDILATVYHQLGINPHQELRDRLHRPYALLPHGTPIRELL